MREHKVPEVELEEAQLRDIQEDDQFQILQTTLKRPGFL